MRPTAFRPGLVKVISHDWNHRPMTRNIGIVLGTYAVIAFAVALYQLVMKLEDGLTAGQAFTAALGLGLTWPISLVAMFWT